MAKRCGFRTVDIHFGAFDYTVHVIAGPGKQVAKYVRWKLDDPTYDFEYSGQRGLHFSRLGWVPIVWLPRPPRTAREYGTLAHEMLHAVRFMFQTHINIPFNYDTDEAYCHALGHAVTKTIEALRD